MERITKKHGLIMGAMILALSMVACKEAGYQVLRPGSQTPQTFDSPTSAAPTARIEVLDQGVAVTWTYVGNSVNIRPTLDTLDPDYISKSQCINPGIIQVSYDLGNGSKPIVNRTACEDLAVNSQVFQQAGDYLIQMQVKSQDNELAWSTMTLRVLDRGTAPSLMDGGFMIHAKPLLVAINQPIAFTGICELMGQTTISWDFADGAKADGASLQHTYAQNGQYRVNAVCKSATGKTAQASVTVVVMTNPPAVPDVALPGTNPNTSTGGDTQEDPCVPCTPPPPCSCECYCYDGYGYYY